MTSKKVLEDLFVLFDETSNVNMKLLLSETKHFLLIIHQNNQ